MAVTPMLAIVGPTACGKTRRAVEAARAFDGEIISGDSRQVYRGMDLGTGKDLEEYGDIPYHLIDILPAGEKYNLHRFLNDFEASRKDILSRGRLPILCGGTGMYVESALKGLRMPEVPRDEELREEMRSRSLAEVAEILKRYKTLHNTTDIDTHARAVRALEIAIWYDRHPEDARLADASRSTALDAVIVGLDIDRETRRERISRRLRERMDQGMVREVRELLDSGIASENLIYYGLEYKFLTLHCIGRLTEKEMLDGLEIAIHQFAKRQMTWFRGMERRGFRIHWLPYDIPSADFIDEISRLLTDPSRR